MPRSQRLELIRLAEESWHTLGSEKAAVVGSCVKSLINCCSARAYCVISTSMVNSRN